MPSLTGVGCEVVPLSCSCTGVAASCSLQLSGVWPAETVHLLGLCALLLLLQNARCWLLLQSQDCSCVHSIRISVHSIRITSCQAMQAGMRLKF